MSEMEPGWYCPHDMCHGGCAPTQATWDAITAENARLALGPKVAEDLRARVAALEAERDELRKELEDLEHVCEFCDERENSREHKGEDEVFHSWACLRCHYREKAAARTQALEEAARVADDGIPGVTSGNHLLASAIRALGKGKNP